VVAVTGTNGKTSTADFLRQIWTAAGERAASLGTLGLVAEGFPRGPSLTTPDPVALHATLAALARAGFGAAAMEASSHGLDQRRLDGVVLAAAGFTNLTRDHLDYHGSMEAYRAAKLRLFDTLLPAGATGAACTEMDAATLQALRDIARARRFRLLTVGEAGEAIRLIAARPLPDGQAIEAEAFGARHEIHLPLPGRFQADNALLAAALAVGAGMAPDQAFAALPRLLGVDYAHTPDALRKALMTLRALQPKRIITVFGCGGNRDALKRPQMGAVAEEYSDLVAVTSDNPRDEDPAEIAKQVVAGMRGGSDRILVEIDRRKAIEMALRNARRDDIVLIAGKGHESTQEVAGRLSDFSDGVAVRTILADLGGDLRRGPRGEGVSR